MWGLIRRYPVAFVLALLMHLGIIALMVFGLDWLNPPEPQLPRVNIVQATLIDERELRKVEEQKKKHAEEEKRRALEKRKRKEAEAKKAAEAKRKAELKRKRKEEARRKAEAEKKAEAERKRKLALQKKKAAEKKRKAELERKRRLEEKKRKEAEAKKKAEARRRAEQKAREAELAAQLEAEQDARERASITAAIKRKVENSWLRPPSAANRDLEAKVRVRLNESGSVLLVQVIESSGNDAFDRSVEAAVYRADPLPMPKSPRLISEFRDFTFIFRPR